MISGRSIRSGAMHLIINDLFKPRPASTPPASGNLATAWGWRICASRSPNKIASPKTVRLCLRKQAQPLIVKLTLLFSYFTLTVFVVLKNVKLSLPISPIAGSACSAERTHGRQGHSSFGRQRGDTSRHQPPIFSRRLRPVPNGPLVCGTLEP